MPRQKYRKLHAAAFCFAHVSRRATVIAEHVDAQLKTIYRYKKDPEWDKTLDELGYTGDRAFEQEPKRNVQRDNPKYQKAKDAYEKYLADESIPDHKLASLTAKQTKLPRQTIHRWIKTYKWHTRNKISTE